VVSIKVRVKPNSVYNPDDAASPSILSGFGYLRPAVVMFEYNNSAGAQLNTNDMADKIDVCWPVNWDQWTSF
jgi:hypothetical protein